MILSKNSLKAVELSSVDKAIPVLNNIHVTSDGTTIAANGKSVVAVSPVKKEIKDNVPLDESNGKLSCTVANDTIKEVVRNIPRDTMFNGLLEYCDFDKGKFTLTDGKRKKTIEGKLYNRNYIDFRKILKQVDLNKSRLRIVLNRKRLMKLLDVIDKICPDSSGESPVYIDFTENNGMILRSINYKNGQRCLGLMNSYKGIEGNWLESDLWEKKITGKKQAFKRK